MTKKLIFALLIVVATPSVAKADTFLQFTQITFNNPWAITANGGGTATTISAINVPVAVNFDENVCLVVGCGGVTDGTFFLNFASTSVGNATNVAGEIRQNFGTPPSFISFYSGANQTGTNLLTVNFSDSVFGSAGGSGVTLEASQPPDIFTGSSTVIDPLKLFTPRGFALSFSDWTPGLAINNLTIASATADATGTFSASPTAEVVPEPATLVLLGSGLALLARRRRARK